MKTWEIIITIILVKFFTQKKTLFKSGNHWKKILYWISLIQSMICDFKRKLLHPIYFAQNDLTMMCFTTKIKMYQKLEMNYLFLATAFFQLLDPGAKLVKIFLHLPDGVSKLVGHLQIQILVVRHGNPGSQLRRIFRWLNRVSVF